MDLISMRRSPGRVSLENLGFAHSMVSVRECFHLSGRKWDQFVSWLKGMVKKRPDTQERLPVALRGWRERVHGVRLDRLYVLWPECVLLWEISRRRNKECRPARERQNLGWKMGYCQGNKM